MSPKALGRPQRQVDVGRKEAFRARQPGFSGTASPGSYSNSRPGRGLETIEELIKAGNKP